MTLNPDPLTQNQAAYILFASSQRSNYYTTDCDDRTSQKILYNIETDATNYVVATNISSLRHPMVREQFGGLRILAFNASMFVSY